MYKTFPLLSFFLFGLEKRSAQVEVTCVSFLSSLVSLLVQSSFIPSVHTSGQALSFSRRSFTCKHVCTISLSLSTTRMHADVHLYSQAPDNDGCTCFLHRVLIVLLRLPSPPPTHARIHACTRAQAYKYTHTHTQRRQESGWEKAIIIDANYCPWPFPQKELPTVSPPDVGINPDHFLRTPVIHAHLRTAATYNNPLRKMCLQTQNQNLCS